MRLVASAWAFPFLLGIASAVGSARAQPADTRYARGVALLEAGATERARDAFTQAFAAAPTPTHGLALAATRQELGELSAAIELYDRLLAGELGALDDGRRDAIQIARARADEGRAALTVEASHAAVIWIDGRSVGEVTPGRPLTRRVDPGVHRVEAVHGSTRREVGVSLDPGGANTVSIVLPEHRPTGGVAPPRPRIGGPILLASGALPLSAAIGLGVAFRGHVDDAEAAPDHRSAQLALDDARPLGHAATAAFVVAGVVIAAGIVWTLLTHLRD